MEERRLLRKIAQEIVKVAQKRVFTVEEVDKLFELSEALKELSYSISLQNVGMEENSFSLLQKVARKIEELGE